MTGSLAGRGRGREKREGTSRINRRCTERQSARPAPSDRMRISAETVSFGDQQDALCVYVQQRCTRCKDGKVQ